MDISELTKKTSKWIDQPENLSEKEKKIIVAIAKHLQIHDQVPTDISVKMDLDTDNVRYPISMVRAVYTALERDFVLTPPGRFSGKRHVTGPGRDYFKKILDNF